jgi:hypothetical protein
MQTSKQTSQQAPKQTSKQTWRTLKNTTQMPGSAQSSRKTRAQAPQQTVQKRVLSSAGLRKLAQLSIGLRPFQALEYDPATGSVVITTETLVAAHETEQIIRLVANRREEEKLRIRRFPDGYKVTTVSELTL